MDRVFVTTGADFIGAAFVRRLLTHTGASATVLISPTDAAPAELLAGLPSHRLDLVEGNAADDRLVDSLVAGHDTVVQFLFEGQRAPVTVLDAVRRHGRRFHHAITAAEHDGTTTRGRGSGGRLVPSRAPSLGPRVTTSHSSACYGPWQPATGLIPRLVTDAINGERLCVSASSGARDWIHADDHAAAVLLAIQGGRPGRTYPVGVGHLVSDIDVARTILRLCGRDEDEVAVVADRHEPDSRAAVDGERTRRELYWRPQFKDIESGLAATIDWYREHWWRHAIVRPEAAQLAY